MSSSAPGASPMNINSVLGLPTPKTICLRPCLCKTQRVQSPRSSRITLRAFTGSPTLNSGREEEADSLASREMAEEEADRFGMDSEGSTSGVARSDIGKSDVSNDSVRGV